jgi:hypothetical protein
MFVAVDNFHHYVTVVQDQFRLKIILGDAGQHTAEALGHIPYIQDSFKFEGVVCADTSLERLLVDHQHGVNVLFLALLPFLPCARMVQTQTLAS